MANRSNSGVMANRPGHRGVPRYVSAGPDYRRQEMPFFCISRQKPSPRLRLVITIMIYLGILGFTPDGAAPLALGGTLGSFLAAERARSLATGRTPAGAA
jgi:hypothetical protein